MGKGLVGHDDVLGQTNKDLFGRESSVEKGGLRLFGLTQVEGRQKKVQFETDHVRGEVNPKRSVTADDVDRRKTVLVVTTQVVDVSNEDREVMEQVSYLTTQVLIQNDKARLGRYQ